LKEALLYDVLDDLLIRCKVCNHYCLIKEGKRGICGVRENRKGFLLALNYGLMIAKAIDPIEKKPLYHFLPKTKTYSFAAMGCNYHCLWCQNHEISQSSKNNKPIFGYEVEPEVHVRNALTNKCESISYTYSEPTIYLEYALETMRIARDKGLKNIWVTNGFMSDETLDLIMPFIDAMNIDLKTVNNQKHLLYCGSKSEPVLKNLKRVYNSDIHLEVTTLIVPGFNDEIKDIVDIIDFLKDELGSDIIWHISRFFPAWKMVKYQPTNLEIIFKAKELANKSGLNRVYLGNI